MSQMNYKMKHFKEELSTKNRKTGPHNTFKTYLGVFVRSFIFLLAVFILLIIIGVILGSLQ